MKLGTLTQPLQPNYGALLQNYALQQVLIRVGHDVETIDWKAPTNLRVKTSLFVRYLLSLLFPKYFHYMVQSSAKKATNISLLQDIMGTSHRS